MQETWQFTVGEGTSQLRSNDETRALAYGAWHELCRTIYDIENGRLGYGKAAS
jgi:hypothetical protein